MNTATIKTMNSEEQRQFILKHLAENGTATTIDFRELGLMSPACRIRELRSKGYNIRTTLVTVKDSAGIEHNRVAEYFLSSGKNAND